MVKIIKTIKFPKSSGIIINMMPIIIGQDDTLPGSIINYKDIVNICNLKQGSKAYLTINETLLNPGQFQRRPGIHTDGTSGGPWGGGGWGGKGIFIASSDGNCNIWNCTDFNSDSQGSVVKPTISPIKAKSNTLYNISDRTPHESLASNKKQLRQFFRLVSDKINVWWAQHSTKSPLGIIPNAMIEYSRKF